MKPGGGMWTSQKRDPFEEAIEAVDAARREYEHRILKIREELKTERENDRAKR